MEENKIKYPPNVCLAPFVYLTFDPVHNVSPCPALGGCVWQFKDKSIREIWSSPEVTEFRQAMLENKRHEVCSRCWEEESVGLRSQRTRLWDMCSDPDGTTTRILETDRTPQDALEPASYAEGPMQLAIKISNVCNLRCRSCNSNDSVTLAVEGKVYFEKFGMDKVVNVYYQETEPKTFTDEKIDQVVDMCHNVRRLEFYGGEPLLDKQLPKLLKKLVDIGYAPQITINISTNITQELDDSLVDILTKFQKVNINLSMDGWAEKFTYLRHPGDWDFVYKNVFRFIKAAVRSKKMKLLPVITVTTMNVHHLPELVANMKKHFRLTPFLILVRKPFHFSVRNIPEPIANEIIAKLEAYTDFDFTPIINALRGPADPKLWEDFKIWTKMIDDYRQENFVTVFPEYTELIRKYDPGFLLSDHKSATLSE